MDRSFQSSSLLSALYNRSAVFGIVPNTSSNNPLIRIQFQIHLNHADVMIAEKMAHAFTSNLHRKEEYQGHTSENWSINLTTVKFAGFVSLFISSCLPNPIKLIFSLTNKEIVPTSVKHLMPQHKVLGIRLLLSIIN